MPSRLDKAPRKVAKQVDNQTEDVSKSKSSFIVLHVYKKGRFLFSIYPHQYNASEDDNIETAELINAKFPKKEGYIVKVAKKTEIVNILPINQFI